jgi:hypothetical protein
MAKNLVQVYPLTSFFFLFGRIGVLNSGLCACKASVLLLELHLQTILFCLFWRWGSLELFAQAGLKLTLPISASQVARITGLLSVCDGFVEAQSAVSFMRLNVCSLGKACP